MAAFVAGCSHLLDTVVSRQLRVARHRAGRVCEARWVSAAPSSSTQSVPLAQSDPTALPAATVSSPESAAAGDLPSSTSTPPNLAAAASSAGTSCPPGAQVGSGGTKLPHKGMFDRPLGPAAKGRDVWLPHDILPFGSPIFYVALVLVPLLCWHNERTEAKEKELNDRLREERLKRREDRQSAVAVQNPASGSGS
eukprot:TRINITY_DN51310_c0_g1_i1.p2 TRINITY_DN51310_c0_g1~~TRINITY_DN51310_c0_g1_i1.p2  ORF type:complete len:215 (+),score=45.97 TRINITY_DN51310_c0_g1_i1:61-645(+)